MAIVSRTSAAPGAEVRSLFDSLLDLPVQTEGKPSVAENLLDALEICAVAAGLKACHLQGDGFRDQARLDALATIAQAHGLQTRRTPRARPPEPRPSRLDPAVHAHVLRLGDARRALAPDALWIYREPGLAARIDAAVRGEADLGELLGYPACCADTHAASAQAFMEACVDALAAQYATTDPERIMALLDADAAVDPARLPMAMPSSGLAFPYVSFDACPACHTGSSGPAAATQAPLRDLAFALSRPFATQIWLAQAMEAGAEMPATNDACPCHSGEAFGRCCGAP